MVYVEDDSHRIPFGHREAIEVEGIVTRAVDRSVRDLRRRGDVRVLGEVERGGVMSCACAVEVGLDLADAAARATPLASSTPATIVDNNTRTAPHLRPLSLRGQGDQPCRVI